MKNFNQKSNFWLKFFISLLGMLQRWSSTPNSKFFLAKGQKKWEKEEEKGAKNKFKKNKKNTDHHRHVRHVYDGRYIF